MNKARSIAQALGGRVLRVVEENESAAVAGDSRAMDYDLNSAESFGTNMRKMRTPIVAVITESSPADIVKP